MSISFKINELAGFTRVVPALVLLAGCAIPQETDDASGGPAAAVELPNKVGKFPTTKPVVESEARDNAQLDDFSATGPAVAAPKRTATVQQGREQLESLAPHPAGQVADHSVPFYVQPPVPHPIAPVDRENYAHVDDNPVRLVTEAPVSTFSIDVDTGAYANVRRFLNGGSLPPEDAVRVEELINYFAYDYPVPRSRRTPFSVNTEVAPAPWNSDKLLMQIGIKGFEVPAEERKPANLVFLIDVSGSMRSDNKLALLKNAMTLLARQMTEDDRIAIAVYAGASGVVLESTAGNEQRKIIGALRGLHAGGSTNGAAGIRLAYHLAEEGYIDGGINRILLATDGDFNVGTVDFESLIDLAERKRETGVSLTTLGFGTGNYNDHLMEQLADAGNGNYAYIDSLNEGRKVLVEELSSTLQTIAKDVKIQIEFNPARVAEYRLIGYENRMLNREDFNNDKIDAGEIGAGHTVTALYELTLVDSPARLIDPLRYGDEALKPTNRSSELAFVRLRYKAPDGDRSKLIERTVSAKTKRRASDELRFAASVAAFGQRLKGGEFLDDFGYEDIATLARASRGEDPHGYRSEFYKLVRLAESIDTSAGSQARN